MTTLLVCCELLDDRRDYAPVVQVLESSGSYWHYLESSWILKTTQTPAEVCDRLTAMVARRDRLFVVDITGGAAAWAHFPREAHEWLASEL